MATPENYNSDNFRLATSGCSDNRLTDLNYGYGLDPDAQAHDAQKLIKQLALTTTSTRWKIRDIKGYTAWRADLKDRLAALDLHDTSKLTVPTFEIIQASLPEKTGIELFTAYQNVVNFIRDQNTALYHLVISTIDFSGPRQKSDNNYIIHKFHDGAHRDGKGLLNWCDGLIDMTDVKGQDDLHVKLAGMKLPEHSNLTQLDVHASDMLSTWEQIHGNDISQPASYYWRLLSSMPTGSNSIGMTRAWLANRISDDARSMLDPYDEIEKLIKYAKTVGVPDTGPGYVNVTGHGFPRTNKGGNRCNFCDIYKCTSALNGGFTACLSFNPDLSIEKLTDGAKQWVLSARHYLAKNPKVKTLKGVHFPLIEMPAATAPVAAPIVSSNLWTDSSNLVGEITDPAAFWKWCESLDIYSAEPSLGGGKQVTVIGHSPGLLSAEPPWGGGNPNAKVSPTTMVCAPVICAPTKVPESTASMVRRVRAYQHAMAANSSDEKTQLLLPCPPKLHCAPVPIVAPVTLTPRAYVRDNVHRLLVSLCTTLGNTSWAELGRTIGFMIIASHAVPTWLPRLRALLVLILKKMHVRAKLATAAAVYPFVKLRRLRLTYST